MTSIRTTILRPTPCQPSSLAIAEEVLQTANRLSQYRGLAAPFQLSVAAPAESPQDTELFILPGLGLGTPRELKDCAKTPGFEELIACLRRGKAVGATIAAACSGVYALGRAGLLEGQSATCPWWLEPFMQQEFPRAKMTTHSMVLDQAELITAGAAFSQIDLMLHVVTRFAGQAIQEDCRRYLMADQRPSQGPYVSVSALIARDPQLQKAELFVRRHIGSPLTVPEIAAAAGLGERTFARRLKAAANLTPIGFLQGLRITEAIRLAQSSTAPADEIAHRVGYGDASTLRRLVLRQMGRTLDSFRRRHSQ